MGFSSKSNVGFTLSFLNPTTIPQMKCSPLSESNLIQVADAALAID